MRVTLLGYGTRGDVQPQLALAMGLADAGHEVRVVTNRAWADLAAACGVPIHPIDVDPVEMSKIWEEQQTDLDQGWVWHRYLKTLRERVRPLMRTFWNESVAACEDAEAVLFNQLGFAGFHIASARRIPGFFTTPVPLGSTREFAAAWISAHRESFGSLGNRLTHFVNDFPLLIFRRTLNQWRAELGLGPLGGVDVTHRMERAGVPRLLGYSAAVLPRPSDWGPRAHVTGYWFLPRVTPYDPPAELSAFLEDRSRPIVFADLGSMVDHLPPGGLDALTKGVLAAGARLVVGLPPRVRPPVSDGVITTGPLPHEWAFPQVDVVIHHAGAGTTAAAVRAGRPSLPVPVLGDQYLWARRLHQLGVAPTPVRGRDLSASAITDAVRAALVPTMRERAAALGRTVAAEDGVGAAVALIHRYAGLPADERVP